MLVGKRYSRQPLTDIDSQPASTGTCDKSSGMTGTTVNLTMGSLADQRLSDRGFAKSERASAPDERRDDRSGFATARSWISDGWFTEGVGKQSGCLRLARLSKAVAFVGKQRQVGHRQ